MKTMICLILDRSGSMAGREKEVIGGVNTFLDEQKALDQCVAVWNRAHAVSQAIDSVLSQRLPLSSTLSREEARSQTRCRRPLPTRPRTRVLPERSKC